VKNKYSKMLNKAEENAEDKIAERLAGIEFDGSKMKEAFKDNPEAAAAMDKLTAHLGDSANAAEKKKAWQQFGLKAGMKALRLAKKALLPLVLVLMGPLSASAGMLDLTGFFDGVKKASDRSRMGIAIDLNATTKTVGYTPLAWDKRRGYWDIGLGFNAKKFDQSNISAGIGLNLVAMTHDLLKNVWGQRVGILPIPGLWIGPVISAPPLENIKIRWDYKERIDIYITYAFFGGTK